MTLIRGIALVSMVAVGLLWVVGLTDWAVHLDSSWLRMLLAVGVLGAVGAVGWQTLIRPLCVRASDVDVARVIEQREPVWGNRLSSAAQFRESCGDERLGSPALQQSLIEEVDGQLGAIDVDGLFDSTLTRRLGWLAGGVCLLGVSAAVWCHAASTIAMTRLALPFAEVSWPQATDLWFLDDNMNPLDDSHRRMAAGEPIVMYLENRLGRLPEDATLEIRLPDGLTETRSLATTVLRDDGGDPHEVGIATLTAHAGPVEFRAVGGDDVDMVWRTLDIVPAPDLTGITVTITPPSYTGREPRTMDSAGTVEAFVGSRVRIEGETNKALRSSWLRREGSSAQAMTLSDGGRRFATEFVIERVGHGWYWFDLLDEDGLSQTDPPRYELRGVGDRKPTVYIDEPAGDVTVTPDADVFLRVIVRDDLGVAGARLVYSLGVSSGESPGVESSGGSMPLDVSEPLPVEETVAMTWSLGALSLKSGDRVTYFAEAVDAFDLPNADGEAVPHVGISAHRHFDVLSLEEKSRELAAQQLGLFDTLADLRDRQLRALEVTAGLRIQAELAERLQADDVDLLKQTELEQAEIHGQLSDARLGTSAQVDRLRKEFERNHIEDPAAMERLAELSEILGELSEELFPRVEQALARARKGASSTKTASSTDRSSPGDETRETKGEHEKVAEELTRAEDAQQEALDLLTSATARMGGWRQQYEVTSELDGIVSDQKDIEAESRDVGQETLTKRATQLSPQQRADLERLSDRQRRLASRLEQLVKRGKTKSQASNDGLSESMREALAQLEKRDTLSHMHEAAESLKRNDIARTADAQQQVLDDLREFGESLQFSPGDAAEELLSKIEEQSEQVETLRKRQQEVARDAQHALGPTADPNRERRLQRLVKQQQELAEQAETLARQLRRQRADEGARAASQAAKQMREAEEGLRKEQPEETADSQQQALDNLMRLSQEIDQQQQRVEQQVAEQKVEKLADDLQELVDQQQQVIDATIDLDARQRERGSWGRSLRKKLRDIVETQVGIVVDIEELRKAVSDFPVIDASLEYAGRPIVGAIERLKENDVGDATVADQRTAHARLLEIVIVARESAENANKETSESSSPQPASREQRQQPEQQSPGESPPLMQTQLRLLRNLQADVQVRTAEMGRRMEQGDADAAEVAADQESLADDQARIAQLTREMLEEFAARREVPINKRTREERAK